MYFYIWHNYLFYLNSVLYLTELNLVSIWSSMWWALSACLLYGGSDAQFLPHGSEDMAWGGGCCYQRTKESSNRGRREREAYAPCPKSGARWWSSAPRTRRRWWGLRSWTDCKRLSVNCRSRHNLPTPAYCVASPAAAAKQSENPSAIARAKAGTLTINAVFSCGFQRRYFPNLRHLLWTVAVEMIEH